MKRVVRFQIVLLSLILGSVGTLKAQYVDGVFNANSTSMGMGGVTTVISSSHMLYTNPSLTPFSNHAFQLSTSFFGMDVGSFNTVSAYVKMGSGAIQVGWRRFSELTNKENYFDIAYARRIGRIFSLSAGLRYIHGYYPINFTEDFEELEFTDDTANALAIDLAASTRIPISSSGSNLLLGATFKNLGGFISGSRKLPINFNVGASLNMMINESHSFSVAADVKYTFNAEQFKGTQFSIGAEYGYMGMLFLRAGCHVGENKPYLPDYASIGAGVKLLVFNAEFAYIFADKDSYFGNAYTLNFGLNF